MIYGTRRFQSFLQDGPFECVHKTQPELMFLHKIRFQPFFSLFAVEGSEDESYYVSLGSFACVMHVFRCLRKEKFRQIPKF